MDGKMFLVASENSAKRKHSQPDTKFGPAWSKSLKQIVKHFCFLAYYLVLK
jgi:hypothetical protein